MADHTFETIRDLERFLEWEVDKSLNKVANQKDLINNYQSLWYNRTNYKPGGRYKRTNQLKKGVEVRKDVTEIPDEIAYSIGFLGTKIKPKHSNKYFFNSYMSLNGDLDYKGMPITEAIAYWIEKSTNSPHYSMPATHVFQATAQTYDREKVETRIKNLLKRQGVGFE
jgi:hypothetical protein